MASRRSGLRLELSRLLHADASADNPVKAPDESASALLFDLVALGVSGTPDDARAVYELLPLLILRFFGFTPGSGWLETGSDLPHAHREALMRVVRAGGPVQAFCVAHSPPVPGASPKSDEMRFEYPLSNLPSVTVEEIYDVADGYLVPSGVSALAPLVAPCLARGASAASHDAASGGGAVYGDPSHPVLLLSPIDYFFLCMVASPTQKWTAPAGSSSFLGSRRVRARRSNSLPSTRAMFNSVLTDHVAAFTRDASLSSGSSILVAACVDCLFAPVAMANSCATLPEASTPTVDAMTCVLLALRPEKPENLLLSSGSAIGPVNSGRESNCAAVYASAHDTLRALFIHFPLDGNGPPATLAAYVRLLALYVAPWRPPVVSALKSSLYPKPRIVPSGTASASPSFAALASSISSHLPVVHLSAGSSLRNSPSATSEVAWRDVTGVPNKHKCDQEVLRLAIIKCANCRLAASADGVRALSLLADAVRAAGLKSVGAVSGNIEEVRGCLHALSEHVAEADKRSGRKSKSFIPLLAAALGIKLETQSMLRGMAGTFGVGRVGGGFVGMVSSATRHGAGNDGKNEHGGIWDNGSSGDGSGTRRRVRDRRRSELRGAVVEDVPFLGSVWDKPMTSDEVEFVVVQAYRLALYLEPRLGYVPNIRWLGRSSLLWTACVVFAVAGLILYMA
jgi:hypothetical protein